MKKPLAYLTDAPFAATSARASEECPTIVETALAVNAETGEFSTLIPAAVRAGLMDTLNGSRQFTVFAPTDAAFANCSLISKAKHNRMSANNLVLLTGATGYVGGRLLPLLVEGGWRDVLAYLLAALSLKTSGHAVFEIGGPDRVSYGDLMREYARQRGLRRLMIPVPFLTPRLSSLWLGLVTPLFARVGRKLIDSIRHPTIVRDDSAAKAFPVRPMGTSEAIARALRDEDSQFAQSRWSDALSAASAPRQWGGVRFGNRLVDSRSMRVSAAVPRVFATVERIGGKAGWPYANWLWTVRGWLDLLVGGVGMRRGRRDPARLHVGDVVDCWRVEAVEPERRLRLQAEMKLPGRAWLEFEVRPDGEHACLSQTAIFDPVGLWGLAYWYGVWPLHQVVFAGMLRELARAAENMNAK